MGGIVAPQPVQRTCSGISTCLVATKVGTGGGPRNWRANAPVRYFVRSLGIARKHKTITTPAAINGH